jgi:hypothetical protein
MTWFLGWEVCAGVEAITPWTSCKLNGLGLSCILGTSTCWWAWVGVVTCKELRVGLFGVWELWLHVSGWCGSGKA